MKAIVGFLLISYTVSVAQQKVIKDPIEYNDYIVGLQMEIYQEMAIFNSLIKESAPREGVDSQLEKSITKTDEVIAKAINLSTLSPDFSLKQNSIELFKFYKKTMNEGYKQMVAIIYADAPDADKLNAIAKKVTDEEAKFDAAFQESQQNFAKHYDITLDDPVIDN